MFGEETPVFEKKDKPFDLEAWLSLELPSQYEANAKILNRSGLLDILPETGGKGIVSIDGKECPFPKIEDIEAVIRKNPELFRKKMEQGFTELEITPFGLPLETIIKIVEKAIVRHHKEGKLFSTRKNPDDTAEKPTPLELNAEYPLYQWDGYNKADPDGKIVYYPEEFSDNHHGKTKIEMLEQAEDKMFKGYNIILRERNLNIPREGQGETKGGRKQLETNKKIREYLEILKTKKEYEGEVGLTPEDRLTIFLTHLEKTDEVIDDYSGSGSISYQVGAYFPPDGDVPLSSWSRGYRRFRLSRSGPGDQDSDDGSASGVRINA